MGVCAVYAVKLHGQACERPIFLAARSDFLILDFRRSPRGRDSRYRVGFFLSRRRAALHTMVLLSSSDPTSEPGPARSYLEDTDVLPSLEVGIEAMLRACTEAAETGAKVDPINFLATYLVRNNPRHNADAAATIQKLKAAAAEHQKLLALSAEFEAEQAARRASTKAATAVQAATRGAISRKPPGPEQDPELLALAAEFEAEQAVRKAASQAATRVAAATRGALARKGPAAEPDPEDVALMEEFEAEQAARKATREAATRVQAATRGANARRASASGPPAPDEGA